MHDTYTLLRHFADSWMLLALFVFFLGMVVFLWRPGAGRLHAEAARSILAPEGAGPDAAPEDRA